MKKRESSYTVGGNVNWCSHCLKKKKVCRFLRKLKIELSCVCVCSVVSLCDSRDCSLPGPSVYGIFQARILELVAITYCRGSSQSRNWTLVSCISYIGRLILYHHATWKPRITIWFSKTRNQPKCPSTDEWINMWHIYTKKYNSATKKDKAICSNMDPTRDYHTK